MLSLSQFFSRQRNFIFFSILAGLILSGCGTPTYRTESSRDELFAKCRIVAEVTCVRAKPRFYTTFRDKNFRILAMPDHIRWSAAFRADRALKGSVLENPIMLIDAADERSPYFAYNFEVGKIYTIGFKKTVEGVAVDFVVLGASSRPFLEESSKL